jgi:hypothetical protein
MELNRRYTLPIGLTRIGDDRAKAGPVARTGFSGLGKRKGLQPPAGRCEVVSTSFARSSPSCRSRQRTNRPAIATTVAPTITARSGKCPKAKNPMKIAQIMVVYSNGATSEASA